MKSNHNRFYHFCSRLYVTCFSTPRRKNITMFSLCLIIVIPLFYWFNNSIIEEVVATVAAFLLSTVLLFAVHSSMRTIEDIVKVTYDDNILLKQYDNKNYLKRFMLGGSPAQVIYDDCYLSDGHSVVEVCDDPDKAFQLDTFIKNHYFDIVKAHQNSYYVNCLTVRLDDYTSEDGVVRLHTSRSNYIAHMLTNRAIDYKIRGDVSLRELYEYNSTLTPLSKSKFSNHIGINALVMLSDGNTLFPFRDGDSTISKEKITAGVATRLVMPNYSVPLTADYLLRDNVVDVLGDAMKIPQQWVVDNKSHIRVDFMGFGRNLYEGGKPQFYYTVRVDNLDSASYEQLSAGFSSTEKKLDNNKFIYIARWDSVKCDAQGRIKFEYYRGGTYAQAAVFPEKSLLCNIWHYVLQSQKSS